MKSFFNFLVVIVGTMSVMLLPAAEVLAAAEVPGYQAPEFILEYVESPKTVSDDPEKCEIHMVRDKVPLLNLVYSEGTLKVKYADAYFNGANGYKRIPDFSRDERGNILLNWKSIPPANPYLEVQYPWYCDISFSVDAEVGKILTIGLDLQLSDSNDEFSKVEVELKEGLNLTLRLDPRLSSIIDEDKEWLYAYVSDGKITGHFLTERFSGTEEINGIVYHKLMCSEGPEFDLENAEVIAFVRFDGINYQFIPAENGKPSSTAEAAIYNIFSGGGQYIFKDYVLDRYEMSDIERYEDDFEYYFYENQYRPSRKNAQALSRRLILKNGVEVLEGVGTIGECNNSLVMPDMAIEGVDVRKLVRVRYIDATARNGQKVYYNEALGKLYDAYVSGVEDVVTDENSYKVVVEQGAVIVKCEGDISMSLHDASGIKVNEVKGEDRVALPTNSLTPGIYVLTVNGRSEKILVGM